MIKLLEFLAVTVAIIVGSAIIPALIYGIICFAVWDINYMTRELAIALRVIYAITFLPMFFCMLDSYDWRD